MNAIMTTTFLAERKVMWRNCCFRGSCFCLSKQFALIRKQPRRVCDTRLTLTLQAVIPGELVGGEEANEFGEHGIGWSMSEDLGDFLFLNWSSCYDHHTFSH